jgi:hypothetical protein
VPRRLEHLPAHFHIIPDVIHAHPQHEGPAP